MLSIPTFRAFLMGAGVSGQPVYLTRSTMLISHTPMSQPPGTQCTFRRQSTVISAPGSSAATSGGGISSQLAFPIQLYPNNVYNNHGYSAQVTGFETSPPSTAHQSSAPPIPPRPSVPSEETPPSYSSIYPSLANRVN
uniref:Protein Smaug n=1 Tax=Caenorhabditis tropicalis TaxID=1561998 RepID=A0A1I7UV15_9PELO